MHYLRAVQVAGTTDAELGRGKNARMAVNNLIFPGARIRDGGRDVMDLFLFQVKSPAESKYPRDDYRTLEMIPAEQVFRPLSRSQCPYVHAKRWEGSDMKVGFIGLGTLGSKMAANVQQAGHMVTDNGVSPLAGQILVANGATWIGSPRAAAEQVDIVLTSVPGPPQVDFVALGVQGVRAGLRPNFPHFDLGTNLPSTVSRIEAAFAERERQFLDTSVRRPRSCLAAETETVGER